VPFLDSLRENLPYLQELLVPTLREKTVKAGIAAIAKFGKQLKCLRFGISLVSSPPTDLLLPLVKETTALRSLYVYGFSPEMLEPFLFANSETLQNFGVKYWSGLTVNYRPERLEACLPENLVELSLGGYSPLGPSSTVELVRNKTKLQYFAVEDKILSVDLLEAVFASQVAILVIIGTEMEPTKETITIFKSAKLPRKTNLERVFHQASPSSSLGGMVELVKGKWECKESDLCRPVF
jgi:hypothetical protein